jgi:hypothetical protein
VRYRHTGLDPVTHITLLLILGCVSEFLNQVQDRQVQNDINRMINMFMREINPVEDKDPLFPFLSLIFG